MIRLLHILLFFSLPFIATSQNIKVDDIKNKGKSRLIGQVTIGSKSFDNSAILTLTATDRGLLIPRLTTAERDAIPSPATGLLIFNTTTNQFNFFETTWQAIGGTGHVPVTLSGTPDYITLSGQDIVRGLIDLGTDITGTTTATSISDFDAEVGNNASVTANTAKVTNATHTGDVTGSGALTIASKAVELNMLDDGTDGELITWDATGVTATVAVGTSGQVLTSNGVGTAPTFQAGGGVSFGSDEQIPFTNAAGTDFDYNASFVFDDSNGRLGVGIDNPISVVHVLGSNPIITIEGSVGGNTGSLSFRSPTAEFGFVRGVDANGQIQFGGAITGYFPVFYAAGSEVARITTAGNMGIAVTPPSTVRLNVRGVNAASTSDALRIEDNAGTPLLVIENAGNIGIGTDTPASSAILDITTTTGAVLFPRMTTAQRDALTAINGMVIYNSSLDKLQVRAGGAWISLH
ncbi:MAG: hypothetical protein ACUZ8E_07215 [Candidatus Anammoxibacter sp.]